MTLIHLTHVEEASEKAAGGIRPEEWADQDRIAM